MRAALCIIRSLQRAKVPWMLEHPHASYAFQLAEVRRLRRSPGVSEVVLDQRRFGSRWRKRTRLLIGNVEYDDVQCLRRLCTGSGGYCGNGKRHVVLQGSAGGRDRTAVAQKYPGRLATAMARVLTATAIANVYNTAAAHPPNRREHQLSGEFG